MQGCVKLMAKSTKLIFRIAVLCLIIAGYSHASVPLTDQHYSLDQDLYWLKTDQVLSIDDIQSWPIEQYEPPLNRDFSAGYDASHFWFRFTLDFSSVASQKWLLEIPFSLLDTVILYEPKKEGGFRVTETGDRKVFGDRPVPLHHFVFPLEAQTGEATYFLYVHTQDSVQVPVSIWPESQYLPHYSISLGIQMAFFGAMIVMIIYNVFIYLSTRDRNYLFYIAFIGLMVFFQLGLQGFSHQFLWPNHPWWSNISIPVFGVMSLFCGLLFVRNLLKTKEHIPKFDKGLSIVSYVMLFAIWLTLFGDYDLAIDVSLVTTSIFFNLALIAILLLVKQGHRTAKIVLAAWSIFLLSGTLSMLGVYGFLPLEIAGTHALQIGSMLEVVLLSLALADRIKTLRKEKLEMEMMSSDILRVSNEQLANSNRMKDAFIATISHEIKTPMNAVLGSAQLLKDESLTDSQNQYVEVIERSGNALLTILDNLLEYSKLEAGKVSVIDRETHLSELCEDVVSFFDIQLRSKPVRLYLSYGEGLPEKICIDDILLKHLLMNLISNAIKFTDQGYVWVHLSWPDHDHLQIEVQDSGIGMNQQQLQRIFTAFTQADDSTSRNYGGTGLGLVICKKVCALLEGDIRVTSNTGEGTVFTARVSAEFISGSIQSQSLPIALNIADEMEAKLALDRFKLSYDGPQTPFMVDDHGCAALKGLQTEVRIHGAISERSILNAVRALTCDDKGNHQASSGNKKTVLAVDDDETNRLIISKILDKLGVEYTVAASGDEAIAYVMESTFDMVLMDIEMPDKDGYETTKAIRSWEASHNHTPIKIVALSAHAASEFKDKALSSGMNDFLSKPVSIAELKVLVEN